MSRVGNSPIPIPEKVTVTVQGSAVQVKGPQGELALLGPQDPRHAGDDRNQDRGRDREQLQPAQPDELAGRQPVAHQQDQLARGIQQSVRELGERERAEQEEQSGAGRHHPGFLGKACSQPPSEKPGQSANVPPGGVGPADAEPVPRVSALPRDERAD